MHFVVKLFPEIIIKSPPVRKRFIKQLRENLRRLTKDQYPDVKVLSQWDKIELVCEGADVQRDVFIARLLGNTPGVANYSHVSTHPLGDFDEMADLLWPLYGESLAGKSFCLRVKRTGKHDRV